MRPTWAEVDLGRIAANARLIRGRLGAGVRLMAVVKADGYGHGALPVARSALRGGADWLGVAILEEAVGLRRGGLRAPILVLGWTPRERAAEVVAADVDQTIFDLEDARALSAAAEAAGRRVRVHVKIDSGMGRLGFPAGQAAVEATSRVAALPGVELAGVFTHLACSDEADPAPTRRQMRAFLDDLSALAARGVQVPLRHAANTAAILRFPETHLDLVRAGIGLYGYYPSDAVPRIGLEPALTWKTRVSLLKRVEAGTGVSYNHTYVTEAPERLAVLPVGYADGYPRSLSNRAQVLIGGGRAPVRGRVCMDQTVVSVEGIPGVKEGDEVVLLGRQGGEAVTADDIADWAGTISYEVLCAIGARVPRCYTAS
jgi:alanine racemase